MRDFLQRYIFTRSFAEHTFSFLGIIVLIIIGQDFLVFFLTAFLCAYLFHEASKWSQLWLRKAATRVDNKHIKTSLLLLAKGKIILTVLYLVFAFILIFVIRDIGPALTSDMLGLLQGLSQRFVVDLGVDDLTDTLSKWQGLSYQFGDFISVISPNTDTKTLLSQLFHIGSIFFQVIFAYIISYIWLLEYEKVQGYFAKLQQGPFAFFYNDLRVIFDKIQKSFGLVFQAQSKIAVVNTILTVLGLFVIGLIYGQLSLNGSVIFPYLLALGCITFLTSFVPFLGVFIGGIPIIFAGVIEYPGWSILVTLVVMLFVVHAVEGYFLNPRIVGKSLNIPAPVIFLILFIAEHFMGIAGFFLGVPMYLLLIELFESIGKILQKRERRSE